MSALAHIRAALGRFRDSERGSAFVELAIILPSFVVFFVVTIEGARTFWSYQAAIAGLQDATRYLARVTPLDICQTGGSLSGLDAKLTEIVRNGSDGRSLFPATITIDTVTPTLSCVTGDYRISPAPVGQLSATLSIRYPFAGGLAILGLSLGDVTTVIHGQSRIFGA